MMEGTSAVRGIESMSSIEREPRTLGVDQIHFAREAALYVLQTRPIEEAMRIFTEGLKPVVSVVGMKKDTLGIDLCDEFEFEENYYHHRRHCHTHNHGSDLENQELIRDVVTAPF